MNKFNPMYKPISFECDGKWFKVEYLENEDGEKKLEAENVLTGEKRIVEIIDYSENSSLIGTFDHKILDMWINVQLDHIRELIEKISKSKSNKL